MIDNISDKYGISKVELKELFKDTCPNTIRESNHICTTNTIFRDIGNTKYILLSNIHDNIFYALSIK